ncbi:PAS domain-containing protein [Loktanella agnita]|uniref:PAS domain-containing protein n=1 Tax=Loktanella agnita TaxID=287097 RepID=UPI003985E72B
MVNHHDATVFDSGAVAGDTLSLAMLRNSPDCVKLLNASGRVSFMSENGLCAMDIADHKDVAGKCWWDLWPEDARAQLKTAFQQGLAGQNVTFMGHCPTARGVPKDWDVRITPVHNGDGTITSVLAVSRDVTGQ